MDPDSVRLTLQVISTDDLRDEIARRVKEQAETDRLQFEVAEKRRKTVILRRCMTSVHHPPTDDVDCERDEDYDALYAGKLLDYYKESCNNRGKIVVIVSAEWQIGQTPDVWEYRLPE